MPFSMLVNVGLGSTENTSGNDIIDENGRFWSYLNGEWVEGPALEAIPVEPNVPDVESYTFEDDVIVREIWPTSPATTAVPELPTNRFEPIDLVEPEVAQNEPPSIVTSEWLAERIELVDPNPPQTTPSFELPSMAAVAANAPGSLVADYFWMLGPESHRAAAELREKLRIVPYESLEQQLYAEDFTRQMALTFFWIFSEYVIGGYAVLRGAASSGRGVLATRGIISGFTSEESAIIHEARSILQSGKFAKIRAAHEAGRAVTVRIGGRLIEYEPTIPISSGISAMALFEEGGFVLGPRALMSESELGKTLLHELYRLHTSELSVTVKGSLTGASAELAARETAAVSNFVERAFRVLVE